MCERELTLARQEAEGSTRSGQALGAELHALGRQNAALQQQVISLQAQLEESVDAGKAEVRLLAPPCALLQYWHSRCNDTLSIGAVPIHPVVPVIPYMLSRAQPSCALLELGNAVWH